MINKAFVWLRAAFSQMLIVLVRFYQACIGPLTPNVCLFHPTCSEYFILAVKKHGPLVGACKGVWRICRCNPFNKGRYDPP